MSKILRSFFSVVLLLGFIEPGWAKNDLKPRDSSNFFSFGDEQELERLTDQSIDELKSLIRRFSKSKNRGELWLRLAELYVEKSRLSEFKAFRAYDRALEKHNAQGGQGTPPKVNLGTARSFNRQAIELYEKFIRFFPGDERVDQALFFLGFNYFELNDSEFWGF